MCNFCQEVPPPFTLIQKGVKRTSWWRTPREVKDERTQGWVLSWGVIWIAKRSGRMAGFRTKSEKSKSGSTRGGNVRGEREEENQCPRCKYSYLLQQYYFPYSKTFPRLNCRSSPLSIQLHCRRHFYCKFRIIQRDNFKITYTKPYIPLPWDNNTRNTLDVTTDLKLEVSLKSLY